MRHSKSRMLFVFVAALPLLTGCGGCGGGKIPGAGLSRSQDDEATVPAAQAVVPPPAAQNAQSAAAQPNPVTAANTTAAAASSASRSEDSPLFPGQPQDMPALPPASSIAIEPVAAGSEWSQEKRLEQTLLRMKKIVLAMHEYAQRNGRFPPPATLDTEESPLLSWRVLLLPELGHADEYSKFKLDEPWTSAANRAAAATIPDVYQSPFRGDERTPFVVPLSTQSLFGNGGGVPTNQIIDRWSETVQLLMLDNQQAVPWPQPAEYDVRRMAGAFNKGPGLLAAFADAEVRWVPAATPVNTFVGMLTIQGRERLSLDECTRDAADSLRSMPTGPITLRSVAAAKNTVPPPSTESKPSEAPKSNTTEPVPVTTAAANTGPTDRRLALPDEDERDLAKTRLAQVFQEEIEKSKKGDARRFKYQLAQELMRNEKKVAGDVAAHYVLLETARTNAAEVGDYKLAAQASRTLIASFQVHEYELRRDTLLTAAKSFWPHFEKQNDELQQDSAKVLFDALQHDDFPGGKELAEVYVECTRRNGNRHEIVQAQRLLKDVDDATKAYEPVPAALDVLAQSPDDAESNYQVGRYLCLVKLRWSEGLPYLAKGSHLRLKVLAHEDLSGLPDPTAAVNLANEYWTFGEQEPPLFKRGLQLRAIYLCQQALPRLPNGLTRLQAQRRIDEAMKWYGDSAVKDAISFMQGPDAAKTAAASEFVED